jgi:anti-sigma factor RsiW
VQCDDVALVLPRLLDAGEPVDLAVSRHVETCVRCQAELARYHKLLRALRALRTQYLEPAPGLLTQTLAALEEAGERRAVRSILSGRRAAYAGAIGGAAVAAGTAATLVLVARSKKRAAMRLAS